MTDPVSISSDPDQMETVPKVADALFPDGRPWRKGPQDFSEKSLQELTEFVQMYKPLDVLPVEQARILLVGPIGAGKSSFFNTINSIYRGYVSAQAPAGSDSQCMTNKYRSYEIRSGSEGAFMNFRLCDTKGLEQLDMGLDITDFGHLLDGYVPDSFEFEEGQRLSDAIDINKKVGLKDKIHVLAIFLNGSTVSIMANDVKGKLQEIRRQASNRAIPVLVVLTHIDEVCPEVHGDITKVYHSRAVWDQLNISASVIGIPPSQVFPIKNYESETVLHRGVDNLALSALRQMLRFADNFFDEQMTTLGIANPGHATSIPPFEYTKGRLLGQGGYGKVFLCTRDETGEDLAMKQVETYAESPDRPSVKALKNEIDMFNVLDHERIVKYYGSAMRGTFFNIFMEYMPGGSINDKLQKDGAFSENLTRKYTYQALEGLVYLHDQAIIHRDVKAANILIDDFSRNVKLCDFGTAKQLESVSNSGGATSHVGTPCWMSPEVIRNEPYGRRTDIWSLGCTVVEMFTTHPPWHELESMAAIFKIGSGLVQQGYELPANTSEVARDFLTLCFQVNRLERQSARELMLHAFSKNEKRT